MISAQEMREMEENSGIPKIELMENAGKGVYEALKERFSDIKDKKVLIVCYHGNNGGDGFVAARYLCDECETDVLFIGDEEKLKEEAMLNYKKVENNVKIQLFSDFEMVEFDSYDILVDCILGIGVAGNLKEPLGSVVDAINNSKCYKVSVDIPTGLDPDTGVVADKMVYADLIITMHDLKPGLDQFKENVVVVDVGLR